jgi:hypothetical protein
MFLEKTANCEKLKNILLFTLNNKLYFKKIRRKYAKIFRPEKRFTVQENIRRTQKFVYQFTQFFVEI